MNLQIWVLGTLTAALVFTFQNCALGPGFRPASLAGSSYCAAGVTDAVCAVSVRAPTCTFNGRAVTEGSSVTAFLESTVATGATCQSQTRVCRDGTLDGTYAYADCAPNAARSCLFNGRTVASGQSVTAYLNSSPATDAKCQSEQRVCTDGVLLGSNAYDACVAGPASCLFNGQTVAHGATVTAYLVGQVAAGAVCTPQGRTCLNGALTGTGTFATCTTAPASLGCQFNGRTLASGQSARAFAASTVAFGQSCVPSTRVCTNGDLSGTGAFESCVVGAPAACQINGATVNSGSAVTLYAADHVAAGQTCAAESRTCTDGALSGSATFASCRVDLPVRQGTATLTSPSVLINARWGIDAEGATIQHAYGPSIIRESGTYYVFFCSANRNTVANSGWDSIRFATSATGQYWSTPRIVLEAANVGTYPTTTDRSTCDPSVVKYDAGDGAYYYLFYTGNGLNRGSTTYVARSKDISGPYQKFTSRRTWETDPGDPAPIFTPSRSLSEADQAANLYGAGEQTVVVRDNVLYAWFIDDTTTYPNKHYLTYVSTSSNGVDWSPRVVTDIADQIDSYDVKVDPVTKQFVMFATPDKLLATVSLDRRFSDDGIHWSAPDAFCPNKTCFPPVANNVGISGDESGRLLLDRTLVGFGTPDPNFASNCGQITCAIEFLGGMQIYGSAAAGQIQRRPATIPFYRFQAGGIHLLTNNFEEGINAGFAFEHQELSLYANQADGQVPVWRCSVPGQPGTFLSRGSTCENQHVDSFAGYVQADAAAGLIGILRLYNGTTGDHIMTITAAEANAPGYSPDPVIGYVDVW